MMESFAAYAQNIFQNSNDPYAVMLNGHTTFWTSMQFPDIKERRMRWLQNNYDGVVDKETVVVDPYHVPIRQQPVYIADEIEYEDDDVKHYRILRDKYAMIAEASNMMQQKPDEDDITESYYEQEEESDDCISDYKSLIDDEDDYDYYSYDYAEDTEYDEDDYDY
jgi:hypothetical protein